MKAAPPPLTLGAITLFAVYVVALVDGVLVALALMRYLGWTD